MTQRSDIKGISNRAASLLDKKRFMRRSIVAAQNRNRFSFIKWIENEDIP
jgi:hypothetical protein